MGILAATSAIGKTKKFILTTLLILSPILTKKCYADVKRNSQANLEQLPYCGDSERLNSRRLLYVTTLDGKLTALDVSKQGNVQWSVQTGPGSLLSSSIHNLKLTNNGQFVRMIPSLSGGLYQFDGESIDPIPITADSLLSSSFKFSDDLVISGGKETRSYGISARTGQILYECTLNGCLNSTDSEANHAYTDHDPLIDDVVVVRRQTKTVRTVEPRSGSERWNFSVGHHELELLAGPDCHNRPLNDLDKALADLEIRVIVPDGLVFAYSKHSPNVLLWKQKFDHPIVGVWQTDLSYNLKSIDLFSSAQWIWNGEGEKTIDQEGLITPSIYLGMFQRQLYIQESEKLQKFMQNGREQQQITGENGNYPRIPWKPYPAKSSAIALVDAASHKADQIIKAEVDDAEHEIDTTAVTAISVLYASEYVNGNGFFLYSSSDLNKTQNALCDSTNKTTDVEKEDDFFEFHEDDTPAKIIIVSLWFWWKEILVISLTSAIALNLLFAPKIRPEQRVVFIERLKHIPVPTAQEAIEDSELRSRQSQRSLSESNSSTGENFTSRFLNDFELVQCLGKGGFGVVFEAKNKIDDCNYAIKRIVLPNKKGSRERVMREVKTLANCEHQNIVRYFQAWVETPPPGWQEAEDVKWMENNSFSTSIDIETPDGTTLPSFPQDSQARGKEKTRLDSWVTKLKSDEVFDFEDEINRNSTCGSLHKSNDNDSCSFIEFRADSESAESDSDQSNKCSTIKGDFHDEDSDSFKIEFKHSTGGFDKSHNEKSSNNQLMLDNSSVSNTVSTKRGHKRPLSLDLTSEGGVIVPISAIKNQSRVYLYIQMQLCQKQSLRDWMRAHKAEKRPAKNVFRQIVDAVDYVHLKGLIHRDLKPSNIFFSLDDQIKIGDFGLVTDMPETLSGIETTQQKNGIHTQQVGTHLYMSPEQLDGKPYDFKVDIFSIGLIFFELLVDFGTEMERIETLKGLRSGKFHDKFQKEFVEEFKLLQMMLSPSPIERPTTFQIKEALSMMNPRLREKSSEQLTSVAGNSCRIELSPVFDTNRLPIPNQIDCYE